MGLWNNHIEAARYLLDDKTVLFQIHHGHQAYEARDFIADQENCYTVSLDSNTIYGRSHPDFAGQKNPQKSRVEL